MRKKQVLAAILLSVIFSFVFSVVGYGEIAEWMMIEVEVTLMDISFLRAKIDYVMKNPTSYLNLDFFFDMPSDQYWNIGLPIHVKTEDKISVSIWRY